LVAPSIWIPDTRETGLLAVVHNINLTLRLKVIACIAKILRGLTKRVKRRLQEFCIYVGSCLPNRCLGNFKKQPLEQIQNLLKSLNP
jgi:hypothetical protein